MPAFWNRLLGRAKDRRVEREVEQGRMSPSERQLAAESPEDRQAELSAEAHLGGIPPERLLGEDDHPPA